MTPEELTSLQARAYRHMAPWSAGDFREILDRPGSHLFETTGAFLLAQILAGEAEILALACDPAQQRQGLASQLLDKLNSRCRAHDVSRCFLEVAADNVPAIAFYEHAGFVQVGRRKAYYARPGQSRADALVMARDLT